MATNNPTVEHNHWLTRLFAGQVVLRWEVVTFLVIFLVAIFTRFYILGDRVMSHDESLHTKFSYDLYEDGNFVHTPLMHGPILFHVNALMYALFGDNDFTARIYPAVLSVLLVMSPLLFRRWLGRWGTIIASLLLLISPLIMYYGRYIRHDTPSILSAVLMLWGVLMYLSGPLDQRRRARWLYLVAFSMIWNLGSKETAFIYIAIIGVLLALYFVVRLLQHFLQFSGKPIFYTGMIGIFLGGVMSLGMYIILDIIKFDLVSPTEITAFSALPQNSQIDFFIWATLVVGSILAVIFGTAFWTYRDQLHRIPWKHVSVVIVLSLLVCLSFVVFEEISHVESPETSQPAIPADPNAPIDQALLTSGIRWFPMVAVWVVAIGGFVFLFVTRRRHDGEYEDGKDKVGRGFWGTMDMFPEFDLIIVIGTLILPWSTALIPYLMKGTTSDYALIANAIPTPIFSFIQTYVPRVGTSDQIGSFVLHFFAWLPLMALSIAIGLMWNWKRWLIASGIFHVIFAFFFTTVFTNISGLATGMIYSLGYWLEQQGVRRGSQPQYYYLLIIMPFYEFLPVIGASLGMLTGMTVFWKQHKARQDNHDTLVQIVASKQQLQMQLEQSQGENQEIPSLDDLLLPAHLPNEFELRDQIRAQNRLTELPFLLTFSWLAILNLIGYSLAGEKMPWLGTHLTMPLIFLTGWFFGRIFDRIDFQRFKEKGWLVLLILVFFFVGFAQSMSPLLMGQRPFAGLSQPQLQVTYGWLAAVILTGGALSIILYLSESVGRRHVLHLIAVAIFGILSIITFRSAWISSFINYDYATEYMVYAHAAPGVKWVLDEIEDLSLRITDGYDLRIAYDNEVSWPFSWYFRNFDNVVYVGENPTVQNLDDAVVVVVGAANRSKVEPILEDRYVSFEHIRLWWPMQDYFYLTNDRVNNLLDISPTNTTAAAIRRGIFDIWWSRDYSAYGAATERNYDVVSWPVSDSMHFYVRRDFAAQIWPYGIGDGTVTNPLETIEQNLCTANWQDMTAVGVLQAPDGLTNPIGIDIADDGRVFVAEEFGHQISIFDSQGEFIGTIGQQGSSADLQSVQLNRPNSVRVADDGTIFIADTWNFRIQALDPQFQPFTLWGQAGTFGFDAPQQPVDGFWGPRDIATDHFGHVFVADTGNKRVRVYELVGGIAQHVYDIGSGGSGDGQLDEPSGLVVHPDGRVFVADTWNRRISVFTNGGIFLTSYRVRGWYEEQGNRPYLAIDPDRNLLYVTDPDSGRVLVYTTEGDCVGSFGQAAGTNPTLGQLGVAAGISVDADGFVYVVDNRLGRVLKFDPFPYDPSALGNEQNDALESSGFMTGLQTSEVTPEVTEESEPAD